MARGEGGVWGRGLSRGGVSGVAEAGNWVAIVYGREVSLPTLQFDSGRGGYIS